MKVSSWSVHGQFILGCYVDSENADRRSKAEEGRCTMGDTIILIVSFPLIIAGMILTITWGMSAAGARGQGGRKQTKEA
jgi:hypothetical protein